MDLKMGKDIIRNLIAFTSHKSKIFLKKEILQKKIFQDKLYGRFYRNKNEEYKKIDLSKMILHH